jgi:hypothetical protein
MRLIEKQAMKAFYEYKDFFKDNTEVRASITGLISQLYLHGNLIAYNDNGNISICNGGWFSNTTKSRLVNICGANIYQKDFVWYLNSRQWDGKLTKI